nr:type II toxin-antitoxin system HicB family antitoxin [uncultured Cohaesibacter sp.]
MIYIATIHKEDDTAYGVSFPDLPGCISFGDTLEEAKRNAIEALSVHIAGMHEEEDEVPAPRGMDELKAAAADDEFVAALLNEALLMEVPLVEELGKVSRINVTFDIGLLAAIDTVAQARGMTRAAFLSDAAKKAIAS